jgi:short-subunit dehydrogenase
MKTILITGAKSGIMNELINEIKDDYFIYITVHTSSQLKNIKEKYKSNNIKCLKLDVTNKMDRKKIENLDIDILISNAAIGYGGSIINMNIDKIRDNFEVNVFSNFEIVQIVLKNMLKKDSGKIIIMSSLAGIIPLPFLGSYCSTKASIIKLTECLKKELKILNSNINISLIEPGMYKTGFNDVMLDNKYETNFDDLFKEELELIKIKENLLKKIIEKQNLKSIVRKIEKALKNNHKFIYKAPLSQSLIVKLYSLLWE